MMYPQRDNSRWVKSIDCSFLPIKICICSEFPLDFFSHRVTETGALTSYSYRIEEVVEADMVVEVVVMVGAELVVEVVVVEVEVEMEVEVE